MRANVSRRHVTGTLVRGMLADIGFATIFAFVFFSGSTLEQSASMYRPTFRRNSPLLLWR
jgi:hypothetical protein